MIYKVCLPNGREGGRELAPREDRQIARMHNQLDRLFDDFFTDPFGAMTVRRMPTPFVPKIDVSETEKEIKITAEIPGMDEKDINVNLQNDVLTISGEKSNEVDEKSSTFHRMERSYGAFRRDIQIPADINSEKISAIFNKGVLTITMPKPEETISKTRKIEIKKG